MKEIDWLTIHASAKGVPYDNIPKPQTGNAMIVTFDSPDEAQVAIKADEVCKQIGWQCKL